MSRYQYHTNIINRFIYLDVINCDNVLLWSEMKMARKNILKSVLFVFVITTWFYSCSQQHQKKSWQAVIKKEGGKTTVTNPGNPKFDDIRLELVEEWSIGNDDDANYQFYNVRGILPDDEQNIYVLDSGNCRVQKFDNSGNFLQTIGRKGQGPGELASPSAFSIGTDGILYVSDQMKLETFGAEGNYKKTISLEARIYDFMVTPEGHIITYTVLTEDEGTKKAIIKLDSDGKITDKVAEFSDISAVRSNTDGGNTMTLRVYHQYNYWPYLYPSTEDVFVYAYPSEYKIFSMNTKGEIILVIEKEAKPMSISQEEKNSIKDNMRGLIEKRGIQISDAALEASCQFPPHRPYFNRILLDDEGRIYTRIAESVLDPNIEARLDIFSKDGLYLYRASLPFTPDLIHRGYLYDVFTSDETGAVEIKKYRIKNWDRLEK